MVDSGAGGIVKGKSRKEAIYAAYDRFIREISQKNL